MRTLEHTYFLLAFYELWEMLNFNFVMTSFVEQGQTHKMNEQIV